GVRRSIRYHIRRRMFFDRFHLFTNLMGVSFGSAAIYTVLSQASPSGTIIMAATVAFFSAIDMLVGTAATARLHDDLARRFIVLEKKIISMSAPSEEDIRQWTTQRLDIEADEPPVLRVLDSVCHNELLRAMGYGSEHMLPIKWYQRLLAQFIDLRE